MTFDDLMKQMRTQYVLDLKTKVTELEDLTPISENNEKLLNFFHKLKGSGTSYGLPEVTAYGKKYENLIKTGAFTQNEHRESITRLKNILQNFS